jgi:Protein of unknown function (DUF3040)
MALSQDEQRMLAEIERRLAADDPGLASCLTTFRRPGPATVLRSPRARIIGSLFTVLLVAMVSLMVYAMIPFRAHGARTPVSPSAAVPGKAYYSATGGANQRPTQQITTSASASANTSRNAPNSAAPSSRGSTAGAQGSVPHQADVRSAHSTAGPLPRRR